MLNYLQTVRNTAWVIMACNKKRVCKLAWNLWVHAHCIYSPDSWNTPETPYPSVESHAPFLCYEQFTTILVTPRRVLKTIIDSLKASPYLCCQASPASNLVWIWGAGTSAIVKYQQWASMTSVLPHENKCASYLLVSAASYGRLICVVVVNWWSEW